MDLIRGSLRVDRVPGAQHHLLDADPGGATINILLVADHGIFREGTALLLKSLDP